MKLLFLRSLHSEEGSRPFTVPFHKAGVTVEEYTGNCGQTGTKEGLQHQAKMLTLYPIGSRESLKNSKWVLMTTVVLEGMKTRAQRPTKWFLPKPGKQDGPEQATHCATFTVSSVS